MKIKCPGCGAKINLNEYFSKLGSKGGSKSRRKLTPEQAREMAAKSAEARRKKKEKTNP